MRFRKYLLGFCIFYFALNNVPVNAFEIIADDVSGYTFINGKLKHEEPLARSIYDVNVAQYIMKEKSVKIEHIKSDLADEIAPNWHIVEYNKNHLSAVRIQSFAKDFITFYKEGTYVMTRTTYAENTDKIRNEVTSIWFGRYAKEKRNK